MSKLSKAYRVLDKEDPGALFRVKLLKGTGFAGVEIEYTGVVLADEPAKGLTKEQKEIRKELKENLKKDPEKANNAQLAYNIVKVPDKKFQNMKDSRKAEFEKVVGDVFIDAIVNASVSVIKEAAKATEE